MSTEKNDFYDGYEGLADEMKKSKVALSQCVGCRFNAGFDLCAAFPKKPYKYASALAKVKCPKREEK